MNNKTASTKKDTCMKRSNRKILTKNMIVFCVVFSVETITVPFQVLIDMFIRYKMAQNRQSASLLNQTFVIIIMIQINFKKNFFRFWFPYMIVITLFIWYVFILYWGNTTSKYQSKCASYYSIS